MTEGPARAQCGTYAGYNRHYRLGEPQCEPCREARRRYQRQRVAKHGGKTASEALTASARYHAMARLARKFPLEFRAFYQEELERRGRAV